LLSRIDVLGAKAFGIVVYVGYNGLVIINTSSLYNPSIVGQIVTGGYAQGITISDSYAYIADGYNGLVIVDVKDVDNSQIICDMVWNVWITGLSRF